MEPARAVQAPLRADYSPVATGAIVFGSLVTLIGVLGLTLHKQLAWPRSGSSCALLGGTLVMSAGLWCRLTRRPGEEIIHGINATLATLPEGEQRYQVIRQGLSILFQVCPNAEHQFRAELVTLRHAAVDEGMRAARSMPPGRRRAVFLEHAQALRGQAEAMSRQDDLAIRREEMRDLMIATLLLPAGQPRVAHLTQHLAQYNRRDQPLPQNAVPLELVNRQEIEALPELALLRQQLATEQAFQRQQEQIPHVDDLRVGEVDRTPVDSDNEEDIQEVAEA